MTVNGLYRMHQMLAEELCYFQLRMICETIACGCLIAHGDMTGLNLDKIRSEWSADAIFKHIDGLHEDFYPKACTFELTPGRVNIVWNENEAQYLSKSDFLKLYGQTHARTHRGSLKHMSKRPPYITVDFSPITAWTNKIFALMDNHVIWSPDHRQQWLVVMKSPQMNGQPLIALGQTRS